MSKLPILHHPGSLPAVRLAPSRSLVRRRPVDDGSTDEAATSGRRRLVLVMAAFTMIIEILGIAQLVPAIPIGSLDLPLSIIPALGLAVACGERLLGRSTFRLAAVVYWVAVGLAVPLLAVRFAQSGRFGLWVSLLAASASEELVYRLAIPAVLAVALRVVKVRPDRARIASLAIAGIWFVLLPGHRAQMDSVASALPFVAFALLAALLVYRSGSVLPMALGHAVVNMLTVLVWNEAVAADDRGMALACILGLLVVAYGRRRRITVADGGGLLDTDTGLDVAVIDLRDGQPASVTLSDGRTVDVDGQLGESEQVDQRSIDGSAGGNEH